MLCVANREKMIFLRQKKKKKRKRGRKEDRGWRGDERFRAGSGWLRKHWRRRIGRESNTIPSLFHLFSSFPPWRRALLSVGCSLVWGWKRETSFPQRIQASFPSSSGVAMPFW